MNKIHTWPLYMLRLKSLTATNPPNTFLRLQMPMPTSRSSGSDSKWSESLFTAWASPAPPLSISVSFLLKEQNGMIDGSVGRTPTYGLQFPSSTQVFKLVQVFWDSLQQQTNVLAQGFLQLSVCQTSWELVNGTNFMGCLAQNDKFQSPTQRDTLYFAIDKHFLELPLS